MVKTSLELAKLIAEAASDKKARDIVLMNMIDLTPTTDYFVVCSAGSTTQVRAIADNIEEKIQEEAGIDFLHKEGYREGEWVLLNGNQTALMFVYYLITRWKELGKLQGKEYIVKTIVTTETIKAIAEKNGVEMYDVYTGFKWIANVMRENEGKKAYIGGGEESYGFLCEDFVRDKDAVSACAILAEIAAWAKDQGLSMYSLLQKIYVEYGFSKEKGISVVKKGKSGAEEIEAMMKRFRENPVAEIAGSKVVAFYDYATLKGQDYVENEVVTLDMPTTSNVLQYFTEDGTKISIRPSGTEPKIKFYCEVHSKVKSA